MLSLSAQFFTVGSHVDGHFVPAHILLRSEQREEAPLRMNAPIRQNPIVVSVAESGGTANKQAKTQASTKSPHTGRNEYLRPNSSVHIRRKANINALLFVQIMDKTLLPFIK